MTGEELALIRELNTLDIKLYERAQDIFKDRWHDMLKQIPEHLQGERFVPTKRFVSVKRGQMKKAEIREENYSVLENQPTSEQGDSGNHTGNMMEQVMKRLFVTEKGEGECVYAM